MNTYRVEVKDLKSGNIVKEELVTGNYSDAEKVMHKLLREGFRAGFHVNIKDR
nr:MAG: hypothetical protein [Bacteriophage sp.]